MHKDGSSEPFFRADVKANSFKRLAVFSISNHFRNLIRQGIHELTVEMENARCRLDWLSRVAKLN